jgi:hypothetical protein
MGVGSGVLRSKADYEAAYRPGHMWVELLEGEHLSSDVALIDGVPQWWRHAAGIAAGDGTFDYWEVRAEAAPDVEDRAGDWCRGHLAGYTGMVNLETIGGRIIEVHLRFADQWPDLYGGDRWVEALIELYAEGRWRFDDSSRRTGYSVVLFMPHGRRYRHPPASAVERARQIPDVSSVQITFHEQIDPDRHAMPPGGFRVAIVNCWDREAGNEVRDLLRRHFASQT